MADDRRKTRGALPWQISSQSVVVPVALGTVVSPAPDFAPQQVLQKPPPRSQPSAPANGSSGPTITSILTGVLAVAGGALVVADQLEKFQRRREEEEQQRQRALAASNARIDAILARLAGLDALDTRLQKLEKSDKARDFRAAAREQQRDQQALEGEVRRDRVTTEREGARDQRAMKAENRRAQAAAETLAQQTREFERVRGEMLAEVQRLREQTNFLENLRTLTPPGPALDTITAKLDETADDMAALYARLEQYSG